MRNERNTAGAARTTQDVIVGKDTRHRHKICMQGRAKGKWAHDDKEEYLLAMIKRKDARTRGIGLKRMGLEQHNCKNAKGIPK